MPLVHVFLKWRGLGSAWLCNGRANFNDFVALHILAAVKLSLRHVLPHFYKASSSSRPFLYSFGPLNAGYFYSCLYHGKSC